MKRHTSSIWQMARLAIGLLFLMATLLSACGTTPSATTPDGASPLVFDIELGDMYIKPDHIEVPAGQAFVFNVTNVGAMVHDVKVDGITGSSELPAGGARRSTWPHSPRVWRRGVRFPATANRA